MSFSLFFKYFGIFLILSFFYLISFHTPLFQEQIVFFYRGVLLLFFISTLLTVVFMSIRKRINISGETMIAAIVMSASIHLAMLIVFPVTFDRSITMFLLNTLDKPNLSNQCKGLEKSMLEKNLTNDFILNNHALDKRLKEQEVTRFVQQENNCVFLTDQGKQFVRFSKLLDIVYGIK